MTWKIGCAEHHGFRCDLFDVVHRLDWVPVVDHVDRLHHRSIKKRLEVIRTAYQHEFHELSASLAKLMTLNDTTSQKPSRRSTL